MNERQHIEQLFNSVMNHDGIVEFVPTLFPKSWPISKIKAVPFTEQFDIEDDDEYYTHWNNYVNRVYAAIGVENYCCWVRSSVDGSMIGLMAFYDPTGEEIKVKHFKKWAQVTSIIENLHIWN
jgi:hypothetical protein